MSRRAAGWVLAAALLLVIGGLAWWWQAGRGGGRAARRGAAEGAAGAPTERHAFDLYFPASGGGLRGERRELQVSEAPKDRIRKVLEALLAGPAAAPAAAPRPGATGAAAAAAPPAAALAGLAGLVRPFPPEVKLGSVELSADGTAFVDLRWPEREDPPESGSTEEIQRVYSLVDSLALNVPQVNRVVLLWNGTQRITFSGHLDTSRPLLPDRTLLAP
ncbi:MAG TPA: GerMN domain-containing protein [Thermoanaerobaculia bacterium]|nr:GerMN domain-containing protein [Thermoanaerobaculia bacterium]